MASIDYDTPITTLAGEEGTLAPYKGKVLLIVNTATACGLTPQLSGLQALYDRYQERGLEVLGFPTEQFKQEPRDGEDIEQFCQINYGVRFPMHDKIWVNGPGTHPLYAQLKAAAPGLLGSKAIKWNFTKFLVDRDGRIVARFASTTPPEQIAPAIEELL